MTMPATWEECIEQSKRDRKTVAVWNGEFYIFELRSVMARSDNDKKLIDDPQVMAEWLRQRAAGHAPGSDIAIYARPSTWLALADMLDRANGGRKG